MLRFASVLMVYSAFALAVPAVAATAPAEKDWTFLIYLNGNNDLDSYGSQNIEAMEKVGSTDKVNVVVQWASMAASTVKRVYVQKSTDPANVTSPVVQDAGAVDMGDWHSIVDFVKWGVANYPAKHYFIDVWDHGSGWHDPQLKGAMLRAKQGIHPMDISWDEKSGHFITTEDLGQAITQSAAVIGHKVDVYGSDACLMAMAEVAGEMAQSVQIFVGSQETEPDAGWPYDVLLTRWNAMATAAPADVGTALAEEYVKSYQGGSNGTQEVTMSAFDMTKMDAFDQSVSELSKKVQTLDAAGKTALLTQASQSQYFTNSDYVDLVDFMNRSKAVRAGGIEEDVFAKVIQASSDFVISSHATATYANAHGVSIWIPGDSSTYSQYATRYHGLHFATDSNWGAAVDYLYKQ